MATERARWYFDLISPFSYLHFQRLQKLQDRIDIQPIPVLFAGLLKHWGTKGPAELPAKRLHTYQYCAWVACQAKVPFRMPPRHPFNPLAPLRLLVSLGPTIEHVRRAFHFVYGEGRDPERDFTGFATTLDVDDAPTRIVDPAVKQGLVSNTRGAIEAGVFGVPTLLLRDRLFWGNDTVEWALEYVQHPDLFERPEYVSAARAEFGVSRAGAA